MTQAGELGKPVAGVYERLITQRMHDELGQLKAEGWKAIDARVSKDSSPQVLARHIGEILTRKLQQLPAGERVSFANQLLESIAADTADHDPEPHSTLVEGPRQLLALAEREAPGVFAIRPLTPLSETSLLTNAPDDLSIGTELRAELVTADRVDLICAFVKWHGIRVLEEALRAAAKQGVPIRIITTTYMGVTERKALDRLVRDFGAAVKVNYETRSTRLHAKAWLFHRDTGFHTAYVGSSNLSRAALLDGLEWNVRLSSVTSPAVVEKIAATFDAYWNDAAFETYDPDRDYERLDDALAQAGGTRSTGKTANAPSVLTVRPFPHQQDMLERLEAERNIRGRHRNLLVAATGTGKTVTAALDYRNLCKTWAGGRPRLLFVAHRKEILNQSLRTYRKVLNDASFGELLHSGKEPLKWNHVFASVQSLNLQRLEQLAPDHFDIIVIDEFHHATASTYRRVIDHFRPKELLGLTATPERMDGINVQDEFFDGRIAAEMRLWEALENDLLCPFHYFGIPDETDLTQLTWKRGAYAQQDLENLYIGNDERAQIVVQQVQDKVLDPSVMRALGFCVSKAHAHYMAEYFRRETNLHAIALDSDSPSDLREEALRDLRDGKLQIIFTVDLFNEGLDIPNVDTLLLLRPTNSATIFLQQLGRGLRRTPDKPVLTVLDFIGQHRAEFRYENQFCALTNLSRNRLVEHIEQDFPQLPSGCQIVLVGKSKDLVLNNIRRQLRVTVQTISNEVKAVGTSRLVDYLRESQRDIKELYRSNNSWTAILHRAGLTDKPLTTQESALFKRVHAFLHVDDPDRAKAYLRLLEEDAPRYEDLNELDQSYARMLFFNIWDNAGGFTSYQEGLASLRHQRRFRDELTQVLSYVIDRADHNPIALTGNLSKLPLKVHSSYNRSEILAALDVARIGGQLPRTWAQGVQWSEKYQTDALFITSEKDEKNFSPTVRYKDYARTRTLFHWESQNSTSETSPTGLRYQQHEQRGSHVLLFLRRYKDSDIGTSQPWMLLGPATYVEHRGSKPMAITWRLEHELPADVWTYAAPAH